MAVKVQVNKPPSSTNMCTGCPGHCCKLLVDLTSYDIFRILLVEKKQIDEFAQLVYAKDDDAFAFKCQGTAVKYVLKHKENGFCVLLNEGNELKCSIEASKPAICLVYPFSLKEKTAVLRNEALCPPKNRIMADYAKMSVPVLEDGMWEWGRYQEIINDWNLTAKGDEAPAKFLKFAAREMDLERSPLGKIYRKIKRSVLWKLKGQ